MNNQQFFQNTFLAYQLKAARQELAAFRSGDAYVKKCQQYERIIQKLNRTIEELRREKEELSISNKKNTRHWLEVLDDVYNEWKKERKKLKKLIRELLNRIVSLKKQCAESEERRKETLHLYYEVASQLEEAQGMIKKLQAQVNQNYENSSLPSSKCINRKKITNNREKTERKPGAQMGHPHHGRKKLPADRIVEIEAEEKFLTDPRYVPTGNTVSRQVVGVVVLPVVTQYNTAEYYDKKKGRLVHSKFPQGVENDVNYGESLKAFAFLLNNYCNVSLEKTSQFLSDLTEGKLSLSVGMISGLCREFSRKTKGEQDSLFRTLLNAPVMHVDGTCARVNGENKNILVCSNNEATMYFAREHKGHEGIKGTPVESYGGILIHDHEACFFSYGSDHQDCLVHIERYLRDSIENETNLTWNKSMLELIREMIHENNLAPEEGLSQEKIAEFELKYDAIVAKATEEYKDEPPSEYYKKGYNLYRRMVENKQNHLLFLHNPLVAPDNNLCERKARVIKGKINQAISLRSFEHLSDYCDCLSVIDCFRTRDGDIPLYQAIKEVFRRPKLVSS